MMEKINDISNELNVQLFNTKRHADYIKAQLNKIYYKKDLFIKTVKNGTIFLDQDTKAFGVFDDKNNFVKESLCLRKDRGQFIPDIKKTKTIPFFNYDVVYCGGDGLSHFGHFLLEGMNRVYPVLQKYYRNMKFVFVSQRGKEATEWLKILTTGVGIKEKNIILLTEPARFKNVFVPEQAFNLPVWISKEFGDTYSKISDYYDKKIRIKKYDKIYLSRSKIKSRSTFGEKQIENIFKKNGFKIIYPETLPLYDQICLLKDCKELAGVAGTALHLALFMRAGGKVIQLKRNSEKSDNIPTQYMINFIKHLDSIFIDASIEKQSTKHFTECPQIIGITKHLKNFFDDNGFKYSKKDISFDDAEWNRYINALKEYNRYYGSPLYRKIVNAIINIMACFIPGRVRRGKFRTLLRKRFKI